MPLILPSLGKPLSGNSCFPELQVPHLSFHSSFCVSYHRTIWTGHPTPRIIHLFHVGQTVFGEHVHQYHPECVWGWNVWVWTLWNILKLILTLQRTQIFWSFQLPPWLLLSQSCLLVVFIWWLLSHCKYFVKIFCKYFVKTQKSTLGIPLLSNCIRFPALSGF